jgi:hypothetical protein
LGQSAIEHGVETTEQPLVARRLPQLLIAAGLALILLWLAFRAFNTVRIVRSLQSRQAEVEILMDIGLTTADPQAAEELVLAIRQDIVALKSESAPFVLVAPLFGWLPEVGPLLASAPELMEMADAGSEAAAFAVRGLKPALVLLQQSGGNGARIPALIQVLTAAKSDLAQAAASFDRLVEARSELEGVQDMPWRVQSLLAQLDPQLPLAQNSLWLAQIVPEIMGSQGPRSYLILAQNEDELRPTGGFISGAGLLVVDQGQIADVTFGDANAVDDWQHKPYDFPPQPYFDYMGMDIFLFRDSNFWPDFPTSAEQVMSLYSYGQDIPVDGVIAIDQMFVQMLLGGVGPLYVAELDKVVNRDNVIAEMRSEWGPGDDGTGAWIAERKAFMGPMVNALRLRIENELDTLDPIHLVRVLQAAVDQRHLQFYARDPSVAEVLARTGWDGHQKSGADHDFLQIVDTSMGFNKSSNVIDRTITYHVTVGKAGDGQADLSVAYRHTMPVSTKVCDHGTPYTADLRYEDMVDDCYWNYMRVYAAAGSTLTGGVGQPVPAEKLLSGQAWDGRPRTVTDEPGPLAVFANFLLLAQGQETVLNYRYQLPAGIVQRKHGQWSYSLVVQKQAGTNASQVAVVVTLPPGSTLMTTSPAPSSANGQDIVFESQLLHDLHLNVQFR